MHLECVLVSLSVESGCLMSCDHRAQAPSTVPGHAEGSGNDVCFLFFLSTSCFLVWSENKSKGRGTVSQVRVMFRDD